MARPKLTPETQARICEALQAGNTRQDAAYHGGVNPATMRRWLAMARARRAEPEYRAFSAAIKKAESQAAVHYVAVIKKATIGGAVVERKTVTKKDGTVEITEKYAQPLWTPAAWWLERMREEFSRSSAEGRDLSDRLQEIERRVAGIVPGPKADDPPGEAAHASGGVVGEPGPVPPGPGGICP